MQKPRAGIHEVIEKLIEAIGLKEAGDPRAGADIVAKFLGVSRTTVYKWTDPDQGGEISFARVRLLTEHFGISVAAEDLARLAGGEFTPGAVVPTGVSWFEKFAEKERLEGRLGEVLGKALADMRIDAVEGRAALAAIDEDIEAKRRLRARVAQAMTEASEERVIRMTGGARQ